HAQTEAVLYNFCSDFCLDGEAPTGTLTPDGYGGLYGTTAFGGLSEEGLSCYFDIGCGIVFQLVPEPSGGCPSGSTAGNGWCEYVVYNFCQVSSNSSSCADGSTPLSSLVVARTGPRENPTTTLYGTTAYGGATCEDINGSGCGTVFQLRPETPTEGCPTGTNPG